MLKFYSHFERSEKSHHTNRAGIQAFSEGEISPFAALSLPCGIEGVEMTDYFFVVIETNVTAMPDFRRR